MSEHKQQPGLHGPRRWAISALAGAIIGGLCALAFTPATGTSIPLWLVTPFVVLLLSIALTPLLKPHFWHTCYPDIALFLGFLVAAFYLIAFKTAGTTAVIHAITEYYSFIALVGGLFVVSGNILIRIRGTPSPLTNTAILAIGAVLANLVGTTGASMLLIRPFMRLNHGRLKPLHIIFFIFIVSNCGGSLTPIGDPPLYLGFLKGVPFTWTLTNLWQDWLLVCGTLLAIFYLVDRRIGPRPVAIDPEPPRKPPLSISGTTGLISLSLMLVGVFLDPFLLKFIDLHHIPVGATFQIIVAISCYFLSKPEIRDTNRFNFEPVKEVGLLFAGIFLTMIPALQYLAANGNNLGLTGATTFATASRFYFATGGLSAVLDNAPTYLNFLQIAMSIEGHAAMSKDAVLAFSSSPTSSHLLHAISSSAVFFGAMTYIGNGPNFMVKAIAEGESVKMPSFFAYLGYACLFLLPILILNWFLFAH